MFIKEYDKGGVIMTSLQTQLIEERTQADLDAIFYYNDYKGIINKIRELSPRGKDNVIAYLNLNVFLDKKYQNNDETFLNNKTQSAEIIPIDIKEKSCCIK